MLAAVAAPPGSSSGLEGSRRFPNTLNPERSVPVCGFHATFCDLEVTFLSVLVQSTVKGSKRPAAKKAETSSPEEEELNEEMPKKRRKKTRGEEDATQVSKMSKICVYGGPGGSSNQH